MLGEAGFARPDRPGKPAGTRAVAPAGAATAGSPRSIAMKLRVPALNLKAKLMALMTIMLALTLGAQLIVSLTTQEQVIETTRQNVRDLASAIQISVEYLTSVGNLDRNRLQSYVQSLKRKGLEVSIATSKALIINSSNPSLIGAALNPGSLGSVTDVELGGGRPYPIPIPGLRLDPLDQTTTVYVIPVQVEDHLMGYVQVVANFKDFGRPLRKYQLYLLSVAFGIFAIGLIFSFILAQRYVTPLHAVAAAAQGVVEHGLEPVPEARRRDEIGLLTRSFNEMVRQLRRAREREAELNRLERFTALGQLAGALAHEIKNPLNFLSLALDQFRARYAPVLAAGSDQEHFLRQVGVMKQEVRRLSELVESFLHYGRPIEIRPAPTDLRAVVEAVLALSDSKLKSQGIAVHLEGWERAAVLSVDAEKLHACFLNVIANAIAAMPEGGELRIALAEEEREARLSFSDSGQGIDPELAPHIFEPFFTTKREGIGLGLFVSKAIVESHGGTIAIGPTPSGRGTTVVFTFPLKAGAAISDESSVGPGSRG